MEHEGEITDDLLLDYIDGVLSEGDKKVVQEKITKDQSLMERYTYLKQMDNHLQKLTLITPPDSFTAQVMSDLRYSIYEINRKSKLNGIFILMIGIITVLIGAVFISQGWNDVSFSKYFETSPLTNAIELPSQNFSLVFNMNIITQGLLFTLVIFSLLLLDRVVLKPYFKQRRSSLDY